MQKLYNIIAPIIGIIIGCIILFYPLGSFLSLSIQHDALLNFSSALSVTNLQSLYNSFVVGTLSSIIATIFALWISFVVSNTDYKFRQIVGFLIWTILLLPTYFIAIGWEMVCSLIPSLTTIIHSPFVVILILGLKQVVLSYIPLSIGWKVIPKHLDDAGKTFGFSTIKQIWVRVRMITPAIFASLAISYANSIQDFGVASTLAYTSHFPLITYTIFEHINSFPINFPVGAAQSILLIIILLPALLVQYLISKRSPHYTILNGINAQITTIKLSVVNQFVTTAMMIIFFGLSIGVPLLSALYMSIYHYGVDSINIQRYMSIFTDVSYFHSFGYSLMLGIIAGIIATVGSIYTATKILTTTLLGRFVDGTLLLLLALPGVVIGSGYIFAYNQSWIPLYGGSTILWLAYIAIVLPYGTRLMLGPISQLHKSINEAGIISGLNSFQIWWYIRIPILIRPVVLIMFLLSIEAMFELPATELLYPPGMLPLPVLITQTSGMGEYGLAATMQIASIGLVGVLFGLIYICLRKIVIPAHWWVRT